jgi:hypothetical protein
MTFLRITGPYRDMRTVHKLHVVSMIASLMELRCLAYRDIFL